MTKKHLPLILILALILVLVFIFWKYQSVPDTSPTGTTAPPQIKPTLNSKLKDKKEPEIDIENQRIGGKKVVGLKPGSEKEELPKLQVANTVTEYWEENLKKTFQAQGGESLRNIEIKKVESFIWVHEGIALNVESVIVTLQNDQGSETIFRTLVNSQTGKILKNWDQPITDSVNPRENAGVKLDPRYHAE